MSQHDFNIANQLMPPARSDLNAALAALASLSSGTSAPASPVQYMLWLDTSAATLVLKLYDGTDWIPLANIDPATNVISSSNLAMHDLGTSAGSGAAQTANARPPISAYATGQLFVVKAGVVNTGALTLAINGLAALSVVTRVGAALAAGDWVAGSTYILRHDGTNLVVLNDQGIGEAVIVGLMPVGAVVPYAGTVAPSQWLLCAGQVISRSTYSALFTAIGTTYGAGDGSTTFGLPDLRGRVVAGQDDMNGPSANRLTGLSGGVNGDTLGGVGGLETHTLTEAQMPSHDHGVSGMAAGSGGANTIRFQDVNVTPVTKNTGLAGSGQAHNNVQPTIILNYIIFTGV